MTQLESALEQLVDDATWLPDWQGVLAQTGMPQRRRLLTRRRVIVAVVVAAAVIIPLAAVAAANDWWFFRTAGSPTPASAPVVVKTGVWEGHPWRLVAYPSETGSLCVSMVPGTGSDSSSGAAMGCAPIKGVARTTQTKPGAAAMTITYLSGSPTTVLPAYIVGPVIEDAATVAIRLSDGTTIRTPTFAGPSPLEHVRFYAVQLPGSPVRSPTTTPPFRVLPMEWIAGLDDSGQVVACHAHATMTNGISPLSACN
jgi:hypothetical protein